MHEVLFDDKDDEKRLQTDHIKVKATIVEKFLVDKSLLELKFIRVD